MRFPLAGMIMVMIGGMLFFIWIMFRYAFREMQNILWSSANKTMDGSQLVDWTTNSGQLFDAFGIIGVLMMGIAIVLFVVDSLSHRPGDTM